MRSVRGACFAGTMILGTALLFTGGCGYKNLPVPPDTVVPKAINDLRYTTGDDGVELTWTYPVETISGDNIIAISSFDLYRAEIAVDDYCSTCPVPFGEPLEVPGGLSQEEGQRRAATYKAGLLKDNHKYFFKVQARNNWWASGADSNIITFVWQQPAVAPTGFEATSAGNTIRLGWQPVTKLKDGSPAKADVVYQLYKSAGEEEFAAWGRASSDTNRVDDEVEKGTAYRYKVQSMTRIGKDTFEGGMSGIVTASVLDTTAPSVPASVKAIQTAGGVKVIWESVRGDDVAGYNVYRKGAAKGYEKIGTVKVPYTIFEDTSAKEGAAYSYSVTAFDTANPPNESKKSGEAKIRP